MKYFLCNKFILVQQGMDACFLITFIYIIIPLTDDDVCIHE